MNIILDERNIENFPNVPCSNCNSTTHVRQIKVFDALGNTRGYDYLCFDCYEPQIFWTHYNRNFHSPANSPTCQPQ